MRAAAVGVALTAGAVLVAGCGSSSTATSTTLSVPQAQAAAVATFRTAGNAICTAQHKAVAAVGARMIAAEKANQLPTLADTKALNAHLVQEAKQIAALPAPPALASAHAQLNANFAAYVHRAQALLAQYGAKSIAYDANDTQLLTASKQLVASLDRLGLAACK